MAINAIGSVSIYEYYYSINKKDEEKNTSPLAQEMKKYGLVPTENESLNMAMLQKAKNDSQNVQQGVSQVTPDYERPWADLMYQLNLSFNPDPKDDIQDIKDELKSLAIGIEDKELEDEISSLESYVEKLYLNFQQNYDAGYSYSKTLTEELSNLSMLNQIRLR